MQLNFTILLAGGDSGGRFPFQHLSSDLLIFQLNLTPLGFISSKLKLPAEDPFCQFSRSALVNCSHDRNDLKVAAPEVGQRSAQFSYQ